MAAERLGGRQKKKNGRSREKWKPLWVFWPAELLIAISLTPTTLLLLLLQLIPHIETTAYTHSQKELDKNSVATWHIVEPFLPQKETAQQSR